MDIDIAGIDVVIQSHGLPGYYFHVGQFIIFMLSCGFNGAIYSEQEEEQVLWKWLFV